VIPGSRGLDHLNKRTYSRTTTERNPSMAWIEKYKTLRGEPRYRVGYRLGDGKKRGRSFTRKRDAEIFKIEIGRRELLGELFEESPQTLGQFAGLRLERGRVIVEESEAGWFGRYRLMVKPNTYQRRKDAVQHLHSLVSVRIDQLSRSGVDDLVMRIGSTTPRTATMVLQMVKQILRDARERGHRVSSTIFEIRPPRYEAPSPNFLTKEEVEHLAACASEGRLIRFAALTGLRQHELFDLTDADVNGEDRSITVRTSKTAAGRRTIPLVREARLIVAEQRLARPKGCELVFPSPNGKHWDKDNFNYRVLKPAVAAAQLRSTHFTFHDLRHTFASLMVAAGTQPKTLQTLLGHADIRMTMNVYSHLYEGADLAAMEQFERFLESAAAPSLPHAVVGDVNVEAGDAAP
jgi:integrase